MSRASVVDFDLSSASTRFCADFSAMRSRPATVAASSRYRSAGERTKSASTSWSTSFSPIPSISIARREAKCSNACLRCAAQNSPPVQRATASSSCRTTAESHTGHLPGMTNLRAFAGRFSAMVITTSGITSPARRTTTVSPIRTSLRFSSSSLCSVALVTVAPPTNTGLSRATGVSAPVRPTCTSMSSTSVVASSAGNLCATANRGALDTKPNSRCAASSLTLYTTPSTSNGSFSRDFIIRA